MKKHVAVGFSLLARVASRREVPVRVRCSNTAGQTQGLVEESYDLEVHRSTVARHQTTEAEPIEWEVAIFCDNGALCSEVELIVITRQARPNVSLEGAHLLVPGLRRKHNQIAWARTKGAAHVQAIPIKRIVRQCALVQEGGKKPLEWIPNKGGQLPAATRLDDFVLRHIFECCAEHQRPGTTIQLVEEGLELREADLRYPAQGKLPPRVKNHAPVEVVACEWPIPGNGSRLRRARKTRQVTGCQVSGLQDATPDAVPRRLRCLQCSRRGHSPSNLQVELPPQAEFLLQCMAIAGRAHSDRGIVVCSRRIEKPAPALPA
eukprot:CAMPEP_0115273748 /NCGR_PEP_ID=MMETSP0270-20121206/55306_1 /TAXON_ID=71861 /ORGANISM="Scrippsiella trochoidea, Strain CCMP3099" /LENGTH=318 /DNA_ID=CAMNT_0002690211 /DNA_START=156 /DNA_END=1113 /DNA_ORIENTATION=-